MGSKLRPPLQQQSLSRHQVHRALSGVQSPSQVTQQHESQAIPGYQVPSNLRIPPVELSVQSPSQVTQHESQAIPGYQSPSYLNIPPVELTGLLQGHSLHHPAGWNYPRNH